MAWIKTIDESETTGEVKEHYEMYRKTRGYVPNIVKIYSIKPKLMLAYRNFSRTVTFGGSSLGRKREEMLAVMISSLLKCRY